MNSGKECILCKNSSIVQLKFIKDYKKKKERIFFRCPECDLIFVPEEFHLPLYEEAARYLLHQNTVSNERYVNMFREKIILIQKYCPDINSLLDYGCGPEPVLAELLKREYPICDVFDPVFFPDYPGSLYDLVIATEVFEHLRNPANELRNIYTLLKTGGFLAIMTSFHDSVEDFENWWYHSDPTHICFFSMKTFYWISKRFGFKLIYSNLKNFIILKS